MMSFPSSGMTRNLGEGAARPAEIGRAVAAVKGIHRVGAGGIDIPARLAGIAIAVGVIPGVVINPFGPDGIYAQVGEVKLIHIGIGIARLKQRVEGVGIVMKILAADIGQRHRQGGVGRDVERSEA